VVLPTPHAADRCSPEEIAGQARNTKELVPAVSATLESQMGRAQNQKDVVQRHFEA